MRQCVTSAPPSSVDKLKAVNRPQEYRKRAAEFRAEAEKASASVANQLHKYADIYLRLAKLAERNEMADLVYEPPAPKLNETEGNRT